MDVLLCWSKDRSRMVASTLHDWLPTVMPPVRPWMSERDIDKGKDWFSELHHFLGDAKAVVVCVTPENVRSPWIYYECGQVAGKTNSNLVCPFLLENQSSILSDGPLGRMQQTKAVKEDTFRLLKSLNKGLGDRKLDDTQLATNFEKEWDTLAGSISRIRQMEVDDSGKKEDIATEADQIAGANLSEHERTMLLEIGRDGRGLIYTGVTSGGHHFDTNGKNLNENEDARSTARWRQSLKTLVRLGVLEMQGRKGELFRLTDKGYQLFDLLSNPKS